MEERYFDWDQYTANPERAQAGMGNSACAYIQANFIMKFLMGGDVGLTRKLVAALGEEYTCRGPPVDGSIAIAEIKDRASDLCVPLVITEPPPFPGIRRPEQLSLALGAAESEHGLRFACAITAAKLSQTGNTFGVFVREASIDIIDTHNRKNQNGSHQGACLATFHRDFAAVSEWVFASLLPCMECVGHVDVVAVSINWTQQVQEVVTAHAPLQRMVALRNLTKDPRMLPGDFIIGDYGGNALLQLCSAGMKLFSTQQHMLSSMESFGVEVEDPCVDRILRWLLDALCERSRPAAIVAAHGDTARSTGPVPFCKQLYIITSEPPSPDALPVYVGSLKAYYLTSNPTQILRQLKAAFEHGFPKVPATAAEYVTLHREVTVMLGQLMCGVGENYVGPYLSKKLLHHWAHRSLSFDELTMGALPAVCADQKQGRP